MIRSKIDTREIPLRVVGMRYYEAVTEKNRLLKRLMQEASSYIKDIYDGEMEEVSLVIKKSGPNTVAIKYIDKENIRHCIEVPLWGE